jgi:hypothetical protein
MAAVAEGERVATLRRLEISGLTSTLIVRRVTARTVQRFVPWAALVRLQWGGPRPRWPATGGAVGVVRAGHGSVATGRTARVHQIRGSVGRKSSRSWLAASRGFWATQFDLLYECDAPLEELRAAAVVVGFRFLERYLSSRKAAESGLDTFERHKAWLRELVAGIERE